jgi:hypothetical protein
VIAWRHRSVIPSDNADQAKAGVVLRKERAIQAEDVLQR